MLPDGLMLAACLPREDVRDVFISRKAKHLRELPQGAVVGTASLRRQAMVKRLRPDVSMVVLRGNVETRLRKLEAGEVDATLLALAGLKRLGLADKATALLDMRRVSAGGRAGRDHASRRAGTMRARARCWRRSIMPTPAWRSAASARSSLCSTARAARRSPGMRCLTATRSAFRGMILRPDGSEAFETSRVGSRARCGGAWRGRGRGAEAPRAGRFLLG